MFGGRSHMELMAQFRSAHRNPWNIRFHMVGIPVLLLSGLLWVLSPFVAGLWIVPAIMMPVGFAIQFGGHWIEGNRPEVFSDWRFFFIGAHWWLLTLLGKSDQR
jgi:uncharacterized membrane protein YGL010W